MPTRVSSRPAAKRVVAARVREIFRTHARVADTFLETGTGQVAALARAMTAALRARRTLYFFGNGGSAADAQHLAAEFVNRFTFNRPALPSVALTTDTSVLTSIANDDDFNRIFARQIEALGRRGDVAVGISTSGRSPNVVEGLRAARSRRLITVGLTGASGGPMTRLCRHLVRVPSSETARIQEIHILIGHILCQLVDESLFGRTGKRGRPRPRRAGS